MQKHGDGFSLCAFEFFIENKKTPIEENLKIMFLEVLHVFLNGFILFWLLYIVYFFLFY